MAASVASGGIFGKLMAARREIEEAEGARFAKVYQAKFTREAEDDARKLEESDRLVAERLAQADADEALASKLAEHLEREAKTAAEEREESERASAELAAALAKEEEEAAAAIARQAEADGALAMRAQEAEAAALRRRIEEVSRLWREPRLETRNVEAGVMVIARLPMLRGVRVSANREGAELTVTAVPDFSPLLPSPDSLPAGMAPPPESVDVALDLKIVGKTRCSEKDVEVSYDKKTGKCRVLVLGAYVAEETAATGGAAADGKTGLFARMRRGLSRVFSRRGAEALGQRSSNGAAGEGGKRARQQAAPATGTMTV